jgi:ATP-dependent metalloprotease
VHHTVLGFAFGVLCSLSTCASVLCFALQTHFLPDHRDEGYETKAQIMAQIDVSMGGRVAEEMLWGIDNVTTGAGSDMAMATELARRICMVYSMSDLGLASYAQSKPSAATRAIIDREVDRILSVRGAMGW